MIYGLLYYMYFKILTLKNCELLLLPLGQFTPYLAYANHTVR